MPTTYAHWRFGCDCIDVLPEDLKNVINNNRELFDIGVHGPDIFFYDLPHPEEFKFGANLHSQSGRDFFEKCIEVYKSYDDEKEAMLAYILGFLSHYALDSQCHGYINTKDAKTPGIGHNKIEAEYDSHLIKLDSRNVNRTDRSISLKPDKHAAKVIARFFPYDEEVMLRTTKGQRLIIPMLNARSDLKRSVLDRMLRLAKKPEYADLLVYPEEHPECRDSNMRIDKLRANALPVYKELAENLYKAIKGEEELEDYFDLIFDPVASEDIPILSPDEEVNYIPDTVREK